MKIPLILAIAIMFTAIPRSTAQRRVTDPIRYGIDDIAEDAKRKRAAELAIKEQGRLPSTDKIRRYRIIDGKIHDLQPVFDLWSKDPDSAAKLRQPGPEGWYYLPRTGIDQKEAAKLTGGVIVRHGGEFFLRNAPIEKNYYGWYAHGVVYRTKDAYSYGEFGMGRKIPILDFGAEATPQQLGALLRPRIAQTATNIIPAGDEAQLMKVREQAAAGSGSAQFELGKRYISESNTLAAIKWLGAAATNRHSQAIKLLQEIAAKPK